MSKSKNRRDLIKMTEGEMWDFIESRKSLQIATLDKNGMPHLTTLWFAVIDSKLFFETFTKSQKIVNLQRDPRIGALLEDGETYETLRGVSITGKADLITDHEQLRDMAAEVLARNQPGLDLETAKSAAESMAAKRTGVHIVPEKIMTWDHRKLGGTY